MEALSRSCRSMPDGRGARGITLIEVLVASLVLAVAVSGLMSAWAFSFGITQRTDEEGIASSLARQAVELQRVQGYYYAYANTQWFDASLTLVASTTGPPVAVPPSARYAVDTALATTAGAARDDLNLRYIDVTVTRLPDNTQLVRTQTFLTVGGI